MNLYNLTNPPF